MLPSGSKNLIFLRGLPGCGKTTVANLIVSMSDTKYRVEQICADDCWETPYTQETWTPELHGKAHRLCILTVTGWMFSSVPVIIVHNTFTTESEMKPYLEAAAQFGYRVHSLVVENRHNSKSVHDVPFETIQKMKGRMSIRLWSEKDEQRSIKKISDEVWKDLSGEEDEEKEIT